MPKIAIDYLTGKGVYFVYCTPDHTKRQFHCGIIFIEKGVEGEVCVLDPATGDRYWVSIPSHWQSPVYGTTVNYGKHTQPPVQDPPIN